MYFCDRVSILPLSRFWYLGFGTVPTVWYFLFFKYHTVGTVPKSDRKTKNITLSEQFQNLIEKQKISHCRCDIFLFFYQILELFRQCGISCFSIRFWNCSDSVIFFVFLSDFGTVPKNITLSEQFQNLIEKEKISHCRNSSKIW
jgi:hypothetical protein